jgi:hypothetical protein
VQLGSGSQIEALKARIAELESAARGASGGFPMVRSNGTHSATGLVEGPNCASRNNHMHDMNAHFNALPKAEQKKLLAGVNIDMRHCPYDVFAPQLDKLVENSSVQTVQFTRGASGTVGAEAQFDNKDNARKKRFPDVDPKTKLELYENIGTFIALKMSKNLNGLDVHWADKTCAARALFHLGRSESLPRIMEVWRRVMRRTSGQDINMSDGWSCHFDQTIRDFGMLKLAVDSASASSGGGSTSSTSGIKAELAAVKRKNKALAQQVSSMQSAPKRHKRDNVKTAGSGRTTGKPDLSQFCYNFNLGDGTCTGQCGLKHVCSWGDCRKDTDTHSLKDCPRKKSKTQFKR